MFVWKVCDLTLGLFYRGDKPPYYDRDAGEKINPRLFPAMRSFVTEDVATRSQVNGVPVRGGAERTPLFFRYFDKFNIDDSIHYVVIMAKKSMSWFSCFPCCNSVKLLIGLPN